MKKFTKLMFYMMELEKNLSEQLVSEAFNQNPKAVLTNAAHNEVRKLLEYGYTLLADEDEPQTPQKPQKPKLRILKNS